MALTNYNKKPKKPDVKYTNFNSLRIVDEEGGSLTWGLRGIYPRATVYTSKNVKNGDKLDYGKIIIAPMDISSFSDMISMCKNHIRENKPGTVKINFYNVVYENGKKTTDRKLQATLTFGKNEDSSYYFLITEQEKKKCKFNLVPSEYVVFYDGEEKVYKEKTFKTYAENYLNMLLKLTMKVSLYLQMRETLKNEGTNAGDFDFDIKENDEY